MAKGDLQKSCVTFAMSTPCLKSFIVSNPLLHFLAILVIAMQYITFRHSEDHNIPRQDLFMCKSKFGLKPCDREILHFYYDMDPLFFFFLLTFWA